jgi:REP element-mobilizing transposase RayT
MPQPRPAYLPGQFYHFYNRGASRLSIFKEPDNYLFVLRKMKYYARQYNLKFIAYCLMPNHYHFLIRQDGEHTAGLLPQRVFNSYSKAYNKRFEHFGTLFEDNYKVKVVQTTSHLLHLCRYIHGNPVKDGFVSDPADWSYSNYLEWVGQREGTLYDPDFVRESFPAPADYRTFVLADLRGRDLPEEIKKYLESLDS